MSWRAAAAAALVTAAVCFLIARGNSYQTFIIVTVGLTAIVGIGLNVLLGLSGQISLGHVAFYAIGAYAVGILTTAHDWPFWPALAVGGLVAGLAGVLLAIPALRVRGPYLAMVTIAFGFVVEQGAAEWQDLTGGWNGLSGVPGPAVFGAEIGEKGIGYLTLALTVLSIAAFSRLSDSPWGNAMRAVRDSESASVSIGLDPTLIRTTAFGISAVLAGIAGGVYASISNFISPESFPFFQSILFLLVVMLGGADRLLGPLIGACVVVLLPELLATLGQYRLLFVGALMLVVLRLAPVGLVGVVAHLFPRKGGEAAPQQQTDITRFLAAGATGSGISVRNLAVSFGGVHAVRDLSFDARAGAITSIIGPNGAGKTTALNAICGFYRPDAGTVKLGEQTVSELRAHQIPRAGIARTYQTSRLFESLSVIDNVLIALRRGKLGAASFFARAGSKRCSSALLRSRRAATSAPASFPAVSSRCSPSPAVLWPARKFSCSTSRRSAWRRNFWKSSMISWRSCAGRERRSCSSTRWRRSRCRSPIGPMCCNPVRSSIRAARAKSPATRR